MIDPEMAVILAEQRAAPLIAPEGMAIAAARAQFDAAQVAWNAELPPVRVEDAVVGGVACRRFMPEGAGPGLVVFVHGGGWTFGGLASHERFVRLLALEAGIGVLVPDYRLAPEHAAPAGIDDVVAVLDGLAPGRVGLCGDSAGANIALAAALERRVDFVSLLYGCFAPEFETASQAAFGDGTYGLSTARMRWYWRNWLGAEEDVRGIPLRRALRGLPGCHLVAAGLDPLLDDSVLMAGALARAGVKVRLDVVPGVVHGFLQMTRRLGPAREATTLIAGVLQAALKQ